MAIAQGSLGHQQLRVRQEGPSPGASEEARLCDTLISDFWLQTWHTLQLLPPSAVLRSGSPKSSTAPAHSALPRTRGSSGQHGPTGVRGRGRHLKVIPPRAQASRMLLQSSLGSPVVRREGGPPLLHFPMRGPLREPKPNKKSSVNVYLQKIL